MNQSPIPTLLRRTLATLGALAALAVPTFASAQGAVTLSGATGNSCTFSTMTVQPNGNVTVNCAPTVAGAPGSFSLSVPTTLTVGGSGFGSVIRSGGTTGPVGVTYAVSGAGCGATTGTVSFADGSTSGSPATFSITGTAAGACTVSLSNPTGGASIAQASVGITVTTSTGAPPPPPPSGCAAIDPKTPTTTIPFQGKDIFQLPSGQVGYASLPTLTTSLSGVVHNSETTVSPDPVTIELAISKCPGQVDNQLGTACYVSSTQRNLTDVYWLIGASSGINNPTTANAFGICWTDPNAGPYYVNIRYTYQAGTCAGGGNCGFNVQWNNSGY